MTERYYRAAPPEALRTEALGHLVALYDRRSNQTHVLASPLPEILRALGADDCGAREISDRLAREFDLDGDGDATDIVAERLNELTDLGLVELL